MLSRLHRSLGHGEMLGVGRADVHRVHLRVGQNLVEITCGFGSEFLAQLACFGDIDIADPV